MSDDREKIINDLAADARVLRASRLLPEGPLTAEQINQVREDFRVYTSRHGVFDQPIAAELGMETADLVRWRTGMPIDEQSEGIARRVNSWMEADARRREIRQGKPVDYVPTRLAEETRAIAFAAHSLISIGVIVVPSGAGKTVVLKVLERELGGFYFYCDERMSVLTFLRALGGKLGLSLSSVSIGTAMQKIIAKLAGSNRILLLDEAQRLNARLLSVVRSIYDQAEVPVILAGSAAIIDSLEADRASGGGQLASRCIRYDATANCWQPSEGFTGPDGGAVAGLPGGRGRPLFTEKEVEAFFARGKVRIDPDAFRLLWGIANLPGFGCIRTITRIVKLLEKQAPGQVVTRRMVLGALPLLFAQTGQLLGRMAAQYVEAAAKAQVA